MLEHLAKNVDPMVLIIVGGVFIFGYWLLKTSLGRKALVNSKPRRNSMPIYFPFIMLVIWLFGLFAAILIAGLVIDNLEEYQNVVLYSLIQAVGSIVISVTIMFFVKFFFARGIKGFGLKARNIHKEFFYGFFTLFAVWPIVIAILTLTVQVLQLFYGADYQPPVHEELQNIKEFSQTSVYIVIFINGAIITPIFEEIMFRGLFQTAIRSYVIKPWLAVFISSIIFAIAHADGAHWPALFILGLAMGYAYEKSNSLARPIFIHMLFNGISILAIIFTSAQS